MRRFLKISAVFAVLFFILLITATFILKIYFPPEKIKAIVVAKITETLGRKVSVGNVDINIFRGVDIQDIYVGENPLYGDIPFIKIGRITVGYNFRELFHKRIVFDRITISAPEAFIRSKNGKPAILDLVKKPPAEEKPKAPLPVAILLKKGEIKDIKLFYDAVDAKAAIKGLNMALDGDLYPFKGINIGLSSIGADNLTISAKGLTLKTGLMTDLRLNLKETNIFSAQGHVFIKDMMIDMNGKSLRPFDASIGMELAGDLNSGAEIKRVSLAVEKGNKVSLSGSIKNLKALKGVGIKLEGESNLSEVSEIASAFLPFPVGGIVRIGSLDLSGDGPNSWSLKTQVLLKDIKVSHKGIALQVGGSLDGKADSSGDVTIPEININSKDAVSITASASASKWGKGKVSGKAVIVADNAKALSLIPKEVVEKVGKVGLSGETRIYMTADRGSERGPIKAKVSGNSAMKNLFAGPLFIDSPAVAFSISSDNILKGKTAIDAKLKAKAVKLSKGDLEIKEDMMDISVAAVSTDPTLKKASIDVEMEVKGVNVKKGDIWLNEKGARAAVSALGDFKNGNISVKRLEFLIPELLKANIDGEIKDWGQGLALNAGVYGIDHRKVMERLPQPLKQGLPKMEVEGKSELMADIKGSISGKGADVADSLSVVGTFKTRGAGLYLPDNGLTIRDSEGDLDFNISKKVQQVSGTLKAKRIEKADLSDTPFGASAVFDLLADGPDIKIKKLSAGIPDKAVYLSISGDVYDYIKYPRPNLGFTFSFNSLKKVDILKGVNAAGGVKLTGYVSSLREKELALKGALKFDRLAVSYQDRALVKDLNGEVNIAQGIRSAKGIELIPDKEKEGMGVPYRASLYGLMRPYMKKGYDLTLASLSFEGYEVGPLSMDIGWNNGNLLIDRYDLTIFEGGATGRIRAAYSNGVPEYSVFSNMAGIRFDRILKDKNGGEEMEVDADLNLRGRGTAVEGEINVTRIGKDLLDRGLLRLDPDESNPQIVDIRRKVNSLGWVPKEVSLWIRHGELNMDITLQRRRFTLLNIVSLEKIPIRRVPVEYLIKKGLKKGD